MPRPTKVMAAQGAITALHAIRPQQGAPLGRGEIAEATEVPRLVETHLHTPYATLFTIAKRRFQPVTLQGAIFADGVPLFPEAQLITTPARGDNLLNTIGDKRAALLRGHGIVVAGQNLPEVLYSSFVLEDDAKKSWQAAALGEVGTISEEECRSFGAEIALERRAQRAWNYFCSLEARWDHQPNTGKCELFP